MNRKQMRLLVVAGAALVVVSVPVGLWPHEAESVLSPGKMVPCGGAWLPPTGQRAESILSCGPVLDTARLFATLELILGVVLILLALGLYLSQGRESQAGGQEGGRHAQEQEREGEPDRG